jgi:hypothetical protein
LAGARGEILLLGPAYRLIQTGPGVGLTEHRFIFTGEQGVGAYQAMDFIGLRPDHECELRYPAEDPALRLYSLIAVVEQQARRAKLTGLVFSGFGPTALAAALVAHARAIPGFWLRPADPLNLNARMRWEGGIERIMGSIREVFIQSAFPIRFPVEAEIGAHSSARLRPFAGLRAECPYVIVHVGRYLWGIQGVLARLVASCADWARAAPAADWIVLHSMNARLDGPIQALEHRPENLVVSPPLPYPDYCRLLDGASAVLTDSPHMAAECLDRCIPIAALGETETAPWEGASPCIAVRPDDFGGEGLINFFSRAIQSSRARETSSYRDSGEPSQNTAELVLKWLL